MTPMEFSIIDVPYSDSDQELWKQKVRQVVTQLDPLLTKALTLEIMFFIPRPKSHFETGPHVGILKPQAPYYPAEELDILKISRGIKDALTGLVWQDKNQVVLHICEKRYGDRYETHVRISDICVG